MEGKGEDANNVKEEEGKNSEAPKEM